jgi:hypothetical protein
MPLQNSAILCQRDSFLSAAGEIEINVEFTKRLGAGFFGGEGLAATNSAGEVGDALRLQIDLPAVDVPYAILLRLDHGGNWHVATARARRMSTRLFRPCRGVVTCSELVKYGKRAITSIGSRVRKSDHAAARVRVSPLAVLAF